MMVVGCGHLKTAVTILMTSSAGSIGRMMMIVMMMMMTMMTGKNGGWY